LDLDRKADDYYYKENSKWGAMYLESMAIGDPDAVYQLRRHYVREIKSSVVPTLTAHMGDGGQNVPVIRDQWGVRQLTPVECMRLQGFKDGEITFPAETSRRQQYKQIGNAVTVPLVRLLADECAKQLERRQRKEST
jgi:DNA (cytosine-5)-methyltransferase 1